MVHNERGPATTTIPPIVERVGLPAQAGKTPEKKTEKSIIERISTTALDIGRDILTANEMAMDKFDRGPLMEAAKGMTTVLVGVGLEKAMDKYVSEVLAGREPVINRMQSTKLSDAAIKGLTALERDHSRIHHFIVQSTKDLVVGGAYNGLAFFTSRLFEPAKAEHLVGSLAINATEAMFTKGLDYEAKNKPLLDKKGELESLLKANKYAMTESTKLRTDESRKRGSDANLEIERLNKEISELNLPKDTRWQWQTLARQYTTFSNPATLLGLDMLGSSMMTFTKNLKEVRKARAEKGIVGKRVEMTKKFEKKEWHDRNQGGRWQGNKDKVYYGNSNWKNADQKAQEEYELKAGS